MKKHIVDGIIEKLTEHNIDTSLAPMFYKLAVLRNPYLEQVAEQTEKKEKKESSNAK